MREQTATGRHLQSVTGECSTEGMRTKQTVMIECRTMPSNRGERPGEVESYLECRAGCLITSLGGRHFCSDFHELKSDFVICQVELHSLTYNIRTFIPFCCSSLDREAPALNRLVFDKR